LVVTFSLMSLIAVGFSAMTKTIVAMTPKTAAQFTPAERLAYEQAATEQNAHIESGSTDAMTYDELVERETLQQQPAESLSPERTARLVSLEAKRPAITISHLRQSLVIWIVCGIVLLYAAAGGLEAAFLSDVVQGVFIILLSVLLIPFGWSRINEIYGGAGMMDALGTVHQKLPRAFFRWPRRSRRARPRRL
jgi:SSS family solute:Na+ symporter